MSAKTTDEEKIIEYYRAKDVYVKLPFYIETVIRYNSCPTCGTPFERHVIGRNHTHARCNICCTMFETGLVLYRFKE